MEKVKFEYKRHAPAYSTLRQASWNAMELAKQSQEGQFFNCMTAMLFSALCLEAYLNHLGSKKVEYWDILEKLSPREKLEVLSKVIAYNVDYGSRPFQTFIEIFKFRNWLVHAKTEYLNKEDEGVLIERERLSEPLTEWEKMITLEKAQRFFDDTKEMLGKLHVQAGLNGDPIAYAGWFSRRVISPLEK